MKIRADPVKLSVGSERALAALPANARYADEADLGTFKSHRRRRPFYNHSVAAQTTPALKVRLDGWQQQSFDLGQRLFG
jgi:hypothetical protein